MSGRSAYVRKLNTKSKDGHSHETERRGSIDVDGNGISHSARSIASSSSEERSLRRRGEVPAMEKSSFRLLMDRRSEGVRKGLAKTFGGKKKQTDSDISRPETAATIRPDIIIPKSPHPNDSPNLLSPVSPIPSVPPIPAVIPEPLKDIPKELLESRLPPPTSKLPTPPQIKRWAGNGRAPQPWNKLRKDPELWDPNGDTLVFFGHASKFPRPAPSFRVSSRVIEATESRVLITLLRQGVIDDLDHYDNPGTPADEWPGPMSSGNSAITASSRDRDLNGEISYEIFFPSPANKSKQETLRFQMTTRNIFAMLYQASFVGLSLFQGLNDLLERLDLYMPPQTDNVGWIIDWLSTKRVDDVRNDPNSAAALLAWSELESVRWHDGWIEAFVHCSGMFSQAEETPEFKSISTITRVLLERASLETQVRVQQAEERLQDFDFSDMWPENATTPARASFDRLQQFLVKYYEDFYGSWPPKPNSDDIWLSRTLSQKLQTDFGALYDYFVDREVDWHASEESSARKWTMVDSKGQTREVDSDGFPFLDILISFDNRHRYPHIPHPYPLVPESISLGSRSNEGPPRKAKSSEEKIFERRAALAYTEACNIYLLGSDFQSNDLVDAFVRFERTDHAAEVDPFEARRGRWILLYGILQVLATITVDTPGLKHTKGVAYYLNPRLRNTPPWKGAGDHITEEASHVQSFCWQIARSWNGEPSPVSALLQRPPQLTIKSSNTSTVDSISSVRTPTQEHRSYRLPRASIGYGPGIKKLEELRIGDELEIEPHREENFVVRDFDIDTFPLP